VTCAAAQLALVRQARSHFHHHSVGEKVLAGMRRVGRAVGGRCLKVATREVLADPVRDRSDGR